ncbi:MAG: hypothetical protein ACXVIB_01060 [Halobacteriota archaeon]
MSAQDLIYIRTNDVAAIKDHGGNTLGWWANSSIDLGYSTLMYSQYYIYGRNKVYDSGCAIFEE